MTDKTKLRDTITEALLDHGVSIQLISRADIERRVERMGDNKPWKLAAICFVAGCVVTAMAGWVL